MDTHTRPYAGAEDFLRIRDFLKANLYAFEKPVNWGMERWNWARFHPSVFHDGDPERTRSCIAYWESSVTIWEDSTGTIVGVTNTERPVPNRDIYFQRTPAFDHLLPQMLDRAQARIADGAVDALRVEAYEHDRPLLEELERRGYTKDPDSRNFWAEYPITAVPEIRVPRRFCVSSMAEGGSPAERCKVQGLGFNHPDPREWTKPAEYREVQRAPDYRPELDLFTIAPNGEYASCCIVWYDAVNRTAFFEPVCTDGRYRLRGLGRAVIEEGIRRVERLGAVRALVGSSQEFYRRVGFAMNLQTYTWNAPAAP
jgi:mycothiol synthase